MKINKSVKTITSLFMLVAMVFIVFAGCAPKAQTTETAAETTAAAETSTETNFPGLKVGGTVRLLCWDGYQYTDAFKDWAAKNNVTIDATMISDNNEIFAKLKAGDKYDIVTPIQANIQQLFENDLIAPIDYAKVPNSKNIFPAIVKLMPNVFEGKIYSIPMCSGANSMVYNSAKLQPFESWNDLLKPELKNKFVLLDDAIGQITMGAKVIGVKGDPSKITYAQLDQIKEWLIKVKKNARTIITSFGEAKTGLESGDILAWANGNVCVAQWAQQDGYKDIVGMNIPKEGTLYFVDSYVIPKNAPNMDTALALCNEVLSLNVQIKGVNENLACGVVTVDAGAALNDEQRKLGYPTTDAEMAKILEQNPLNGPFATEEGGQYITIKDMSDAWREVMATQ